MDRAGPSSWQDWTPQIRVQANHFQITLDEEKMNKLTRYTVSIKPEAEENSISKRQHRQIMVKFLERYSHHSLAYDGQNHIYSIGPVTFKNIERIKVKFYADSSSNRRQTSVRDVVYKVSTEVGTPPDTAQALQVALRHKPSIWCIAVWKNFFFSRVLGGVTDSENGRVVNLRGFSLTPRFTQRGWSLNFDVAVQPLYEALPVLVFVAKFLKRDLIDLRFRPADDELKKVEAELKGVRVQATHLGRDYTICGFSRAAVKDLKFLLEESQGLVKLENYFFWKYNIQLKYLELPAIQVVSNRDVPIYFPMEVCRIAQGQIYKPGQVSEVVHLAPLLRKTHITEGMAIYNDKFSLNEAFGVQVNNNLTTIKARVLQAPQLRFGGGQSDFPKNGRWTMRDKKMHEGAKIDHWTALSLLPQCRAVRLELLCRELIQCCNKTGMEICEQPLVPVQSVTYNENDIGDKLRKLNEKASTALARKGKTEEQLQFLIVVLPDQKECYGLIKKSCETELGIISQCISPKEGGNIKLGNIALKINAKFGGCNLIIGGRDLGLSELTMVVGVDVSHPPPGDRCSRSVAALVGSIGPEASKYKVAVSDQDARQEIIQEGEGMMSELLEEFRTANGGQSPTTIIYYRDGVGDGQFNQLIEKEIGAIRKVCGSSEGVGTTNIICILVQKRHRTRFFCESPEEGNIPAGTVVDSEICHPNALDFFICSHAVGKTRTSRPTHYNVLINESSYSINDLKKVTYALCYMNARCRRSVSMVAPTHYAHLVARRARHYLDRDAEGNVHLLPINPKVKEGMFFC